MLIEVIKVLGVGAGVTSLSVAASSLIKTIAHRNDGKRVMLDGQEVSGFSAKDVDRILREHARRLQERDSNGSDGRGSVRSKRLFLTCVTAASTLMVTLAIAPPAMAVPAERARLASVETIEPEGVWTPPEDAANGTPTKEFEDALRAQDPGDPPETSGELDESFWTEASQTDLSDGDADEPEAKDAERSVVAPDGSNDAADDTSASRAPAETTAGAPGLGELPWFSFQDFALSTDQSARVNLANGNLLLKANDSTIAGPGFGLRADRYYNGLSTAGGFHGGGWHSSMMDPNMVVAQSGNLITYSAPNGVKLVFQGNRPAGATGWPSAWASPAGSNMTLTRSGSALVLTMNKSGDQLLFSTSGGRQISSRDRNGVGYGGVTQPNIASYRITHDTGRWLQLDTASTDGATVRLVDSANRTVVFKSEDAGSESRLKTVTATDGAVTTYSYDSAGRISSIELPSAVNGTTTVSFTYDSAQRVKKVTQQPGIERVFTYSSGQTVVTDSNGKSATYVYDNQGRVTSAKDALNRTRSQTWNANSDILTSTDALGPNSTTYTYDGSSNRTSAELPTGAAASAAYAIGSGCNAPNTGTAFQPKCATDDAGNKRQYHYDAAGNLTKQTDTTTSTPKTEFERTYGGCGGFAGQVCSTTDGAGNVTTYEYNSKGDLSFVRPPAPMARTYYLYDSLGRVFTTTDGNDNQTLFGRDKKDRVVQITFSAVSSNETTLTSSYYPNGLEKSRVDSTGGRIDFTYDEVGNTLSFADEGGKTTYAYDAANQLTRLIEPGGTCPTNGTPAAGSGCIVFEYDANGAEIKRTLPAGANIATTRDEAGRPTRITAKDDAGATAVDIGYGYTGTAGDQTRVQTRTAFKEQGVTAGAVTSYTYDSRARLSSAIEKTGTTTSASWAYQYDGAGNRVRQVRSGSTGATNGTVNYAYNAANQLTSATGSSTTWTYDAAGHQTRIGFNGTASTFGDRLEATQIGATANDYFGNGNTDRVASGASTFTSGAMGLATRTNGSATQLYSRTPDGTAVGYKATNRWYYVQDHLGSVIGVISSAGKYSGGYSYSPFGEARSTGTTAAVTVNPLRYISGYHEGNGLYKLGARYYDAAQGRFTQMDPSGQETNPYAYAENDPINKLDPSGLNPIESVLDVISWFELADAIASGDEAQIAGYVVSVIVSTLTFAACEGLVASAGGGVGLIAGTGVCALAGEIVAEVVIDQFL